MEEYGKMDKKVEDALLKTYAKSTGKTVAELRPLLEKAKAEATEMGFPDSENIIKGRFRKKVNAVLFFERTGKPSTRKEPVVFKGFMLGADSIRDIKEQMRRKALRRFDEEGDNAKLEGYVDEGGSPTDWRPVIHNRRGEEVDNPDYHKPILGNRYVRDIYGIVMKDGDKVSKLFQMSLWEGFASKFTYRPFTPIEFKCTIKSEGQYYILNAPRVEKGLKAFKAVTMEIDYEDWIRQALEGRKYALDALDKAVADTKNANDPWIIVEGIVDSIDPDVNPKTGSRSITLADVDSGMTETVRVFIPKDFPLAFREYSKVIVFGRPRAWRRDEDTEDRYSINGVSIFPIPGQTIEAKVETGRPAEGEGPSEEGWDLWE